MDYAEMAECPVGALRSGALVLNTSHCGSTLLSDLLGEHSEMASLQEFFTTINRLEDAFRPEELTGREFWEMINEPNGRLRALHRIGRLPKNFRYSVEKHPADTPLDISGMLGYTLPAISDDPDGLLNELKSVVTSFPSQVLRNHYLRLFDFLTRRSGKQKWVERSGGSAASAKALVEMFPELPVIYLDRDCVDTAISMSLDRILLISQVGFEINEQIDVNPYVADVECDSRDLPAHIVPLLPENITAETLDSRAGSFASISSAIVILALMRQAAEAALKDIPDGRLLRVRYEDLVRDPHGCLGRIGDFLGLADCDEWVGRVAGRVKAQPPRKIIDEVQRQQLSGVFDALAKSLSAGDRQLTLEDYMKALEDAGVTME